MKVRLSLLVFVLSLAGCASLSPKDTQIAVKQLVQEVQAAVDTIGQKTKGSPLPPLKEAELTISSKAERKANGEVAFFVSGKGARTNTEGNSITLSLVPNTSSRKVWAAGEGQELADAVVAAVQGLDGIDSLTLNSLTVTTSLELVETIGGGLQVELSGVSVEGGKERTTTSGNTLKLVFERAEKGKM